MIKVDVPAATSTYVFVRYRVDAPSKPFEKSMFAKSPDLILKEIGTEKVGQILHASLSAEKPRQ